MSDELFRARVEPRRAHGSTPDARTRGAAHGPDHADDVLEDLMASFERRGAGAAASAAALDKPGSGNTASADRLSPDGRAATADEISESPSWRAMDPATLPSRRSVVPNRRARDPWLLGGAVLVITAGVTAAVMSSPLSGDGHTSQGTKTGATALADPSAPVRGRRPVRARRTTPPTARTPARRRVRGPPGPSPPPRWPPRGSPRTSARGTSSPATPRSARSWGSAASPAPRSCPSGCSPAWPRSRAPTSSR